MSEEGPFLPSVTRFDWTPEAEQQLRDLAATGLSARQIAIQMGAPTRNTVIGKANRMGVQLGIKRGDSKPKIAASKPLRTEAPKVNIRASAPKVNIRASVPVPKIIPIPVEIPADGVRLVDIGHGQCRWPLGDPKSADFCFCGVNTTRTYCAEHHRIVYVPTARQRAREAA